MTGEPTFESALWRISLATYVVTLTATITLWIVSLCRVRRYHKAR
jgi:hypothetical protein